MSSVTQTDVLSGIFTKSLHLQRRFAFVQNVKKIDSPLKYSIAICVSDKPDKQIEMV